MNIEAKLKKERKRSKLSKGEAEIAKFLTENRIKFSREWYFKNFVSNKTKMPLFFDFFLHDYNVAIEFDGPHHFRPIYGLYRLEQQKANDFRKGMYCHRNGIKLLRIGYDKIDRVGEIICKFFDRHGI